MEEKDMTIFNAAITELEGKQVAIIWLDKKFLHNKEEIDKHMKFYKDLIKSPFTIIMILDENEKPHYYGDLSIIEILTRTVWKKLPWQQYEIDKA